MKPILISLLFAAATLFTGPARADYLVEVQQQADQLASVSGRLKSAGFKTEHLDAPIMVQFAGGSPFLPWLTLRQFLALLEKNEELVAFEAREGVDDPNLVGALLKFVGKPSFDVIFRYDFGEIYPQSIGDFEVNLYTGRYAWNALAQYISFDIDRFLSGDRKEEPGQDPEAKEGLDLLESMNPNDPNEAPVIKQSAPLLGPRIPTPAPPEEVKSDDEAPWEGIPGVMRF